MMRALAAARFPLALTFRRAPSWRGVLEACVGTHWHRYFVTLSHGALRCYRREADAKGGLPKHSVPSLVGLQVRTNYRSADKPADQVSLIVPGKVAGNDSVVILLRTQAVGGAGPVLDDWAAALQHAVLFANGLG